MNGEVEKLANSVWLTAVGRLSLPILATASIAGATMLFDIRDDMAELKGVVVQGLVPRVDRLESDTLELRSELTMRTNSRFTKDDADKLEARLAKRIDELKREVDDLSRALRQPRPMAR